MTEEYERLVCQHCFHYKGWHVNGRCLSPGRRKWAPDYRNMVPNPCECTRHYTPGGEAVVA